MAAEFPSAGTFSTWEPVIKYVAARVYSNSRLQSREVDRTIGQVKLPYEKTKPRQITASRMKRPSLFE
jgi:hypothetical protein